MYRVILLAALSGTLFAAAQPTPTNLTITGTGSLQATTLPDRSTVITVGLTGLAHTSSFGDGNLTGQGTLQVQSDFTLTTKGTFQVVFSPGNVVYGDITVPNSAIFDQNDIGTVLNFSGAVANITSGTGLFSGATGQFPNMSGTLTVTSVNQDSTAGTFSFVFNGSGNITAPNYTTTSAGGLRFVPVTPCRISDTRNPTGPFGGPSMQGPVTRDFNIPSSACGIPANAAAYSLNVTVVPKGPLSYLSLWPSGQSQPLVSTLNSPDGRTKANAAIVPAGANGSVSVFVTNPADVILDINGYFESTNPSNLVFYPVAPCRISDTRNATGPLGGPILASGQSRTIPILSSACNIPATARAYSLNVTVVPSGPLSYLSTWPAGQAQPLVSTLNSPNGTVLANAAIVPAGTNGGITVIATNPTDLILDINGYFAPPGAGGLLFYPATPCRMADTRNTPAGLFAAPALAGQSARSFPLLSSTCAPPASAQAYSMNVTVVPQGPLAYLTLWPTSQSQPLVSTLNAPDGTISSNAAIVPAGNGGAISAFVTNTADILLDLNGYFAP